jgi:hypothetical protein
LEVCSKSTLAVIRAVAQLWIVRPMSSIMQICTSKRCSWNDWALFPFKAYVVVAVPFYFLFRVFFPHPLWTSIGNNTSILDPIAGGLLDAFILCAPVLWLGAFFQFISRDSKAGVCTLLFSVVPSLVLASFIFL